MKIHYEMGEANKKPTQEPEDVDFVQDIKDASGFWLTSYRHFKQYLQLLNQTP